MKTNDPFFNDSQNDEIRIKPLFKTILREKFFIFSFTSICTLSSLIYCTIQKPIYRGSFQIVVENAPKKQTSGGLNMLYFGNNLNKDETQINILQSPLCLIFCMF